MAEDTDVAWAADAQEPVMMEVSDGPSTAEASAPTPSCELPNPQESPDIASPKVAEVAPEGSADDDYLPAVCQCISNWLGEQKRVDNYRLLAREVQALTAQLRRAQRLTERQAGPEAEPEAPPAMEDGQFPSHASASSRLSTELRLTVGDLKLRSLWRGQRCEDGVQVSLHIAVQRSGGSENSLVEFHGRRSLDLSQDEAKYWVDHELVRSLQRLWLPSVPSPVLLLDMILSLPIAEESHAVPFRTHILEDMLHQECWDAESDSEILQDLSICEDGSPEDVSRTYRSNSQVAEAPAAPAAPRRARRRKKSPAKGT